MFNIFGKKKIFFLIDDDEDLIFIMKKRISKEFHCKIKTFKSLGEARAALDTIHPDCIISDIHLPGENGQDLKMYLKHLGKPIPLIFITQNSIKNELIHIKKPINFDSLFQMIRFNLGEA